jgi:hypothetical protein
MLFFAGIVLGSCFPVLRRLGCVWPAFLDLSFSPSNGVSMTRRVVYSGDTISKRLSHGETTASKMSAWKQG